MTALYIKIKIRSFSLQLFEGDEGNEARDRIRLTRLYEFARKVRALLHTYHYNQIFLSEFWGAFSKYTGHEFQPRDYGYSTLDELLAAIPQVSFQISVFFFFLRKSECCLMQDNLQDKHIFPILTLCSTFSYSKRDHCLN